MKTNFNAITALVLIILFGISCAPVMYTQNMLVKNRDLNFKDAGKTGHVNVTVSRKVSNYQERILNNHIDTIQLSFHESLESCNLLKISDTKPDYQINMEILKCKQPSLGLNYPTELTVTYNVKEGEDQVFNTEVSGRYVTDFAEAYSARRRARMSIENSIKESNENFIKQFSAYMHSNQ